MYNSRTFIYVEGIMAKIEISKNFLLLSVVYPILFVT